MSIFTKESFSFNLAGVLYGIRAICLLNEPAKRNSPLTWGCFESPGSIRRVLKRASCNLLLKIDSNYRYTDSRDFWYFYAGKEIISIISDNSRPIKKARQDSAGLFIGREEYYLLLFLLRFKLALFNFFICHITSIKT